MLSPERYRDDKLIPSQWWPLNPCAHSHLYPSSESTHWPALRHGFGEHCVSTKRRKDLDHFLIKNSLNLKNRCYSDILHILASEFCAIITSSMNKSLTFTIASPVSMTTNTSVFCEWLNHTCSSVKTRRHWARRWRHCEKRVGADQV